MGTRKLLVMGLLGSISALPLHAEPAADAVVPEAAPADVAAAPLEAAPASGEFLDDRWYVAPFATYLHPGGATKGFDGWGAGMGIGKIINEYFNVEIRGFWTHYGNNNNTPDPWYSSHYTQTKADPYVGGQTDLTGATVDLQYYFLRDAFSPYVVAALGGMNTSFRTNDGEGFSTPSFIFETGVGATYEVLDNLLLRADVRYRMNTFPTSVHSVHFQNGGVFNDLVVNMGFVVPFGDKPVAAAPIAPTDDCSTRDTDHDGVNDCDDKCPGTISGTKVDDQGCPIVMELRGVNFKFDSAELTEGAKAILDGVVGQLNSMPDRRDIEVAGFASDEGRPQARQHNLRLSQRRSESVARYLKAQGVTNKLYAKGYGVDYPVASNATEEGRIKNRRVELRWMGD